VVKEIGTKIVQKELKINCFFAENLAEVFFRLPIVKCAIMVPLLMPVERMRKKT